MQTAFYILFLQFHIIFKLQNKNPTSSMENDHCSTPLSNSHWLFCVTKVGMDVPESNEGESCSSQCLGLAGALKNNRKVLVAGAPIDWLGVKKY